MLPTVGPITGPMTTAIPKIEVTRPCCRLGNVSSRMVCDNGITGAPKAPCSTRHRIRLSSESARPHIRVVRVKARTDQIIVSRRPKRARQPAGHRRRHGGSQDVEGHGPGDFVLGGRHGALHLGQQGRGDQQGGRVQGRAQNHHDEKSGPASPARFRARRLGGRRRRWWRLNSWPGLL